LKAHFEEEDEPEPDVVEQSTEDVQVILVDQTAINLVEQTHENERVENKSVQNHLVGRVTLHNVVIWV